MSDDISCGPQKTKCRAKFRPERRRLKRMATRKAKRCLCCECKFTFSPKEGWQNPFAVEKNLRKTINNLKEDDYENYIKLWAEESKERDIDCYEVPLHVTFKKTHSLCLICALNYVLNYLEEVSTDFFKENTPTRFILCYKVLQDAEENGLENNVCGVKIELLSIWYLFPPIPVGILDCFPKIQELFKNEVILPHQSLHEVLYIFTKKFDDIFSSSNRVCIDNECFGTMSLSRAYSSQRWICAKCRSEYCCECKADHKGKSCDDFTRYLDLDDETKELFEAEFRWGKSKLCPGCRQIIQKTEGCNHMICEMCKTHFCWICLWKAPRVSEFGTSPIYAHMDRQHNGWF